MVTQDNFTLLNAHELQGKNLQSLGQTTVNRKNGFYKLWLDLDTGKRYKELRRAQ